MALVFSLLHSARWRAVGSVAAVMVLAACGTDVAVDPPASPPKGIVVLDGYIQPGLTLLADTGKASSRVALGDPTTFDASGFTMANDTVLAVSSRGAGDLLYIADLRTGTTRKIQMPVGSNPGNARLLKGTGGQSLIGVALRDSGSVSLVSVAGTATATSTRITNAGICPTDVFQYDNATWVVDANANCRTTYTLRGDVRLIRIPNTGTTRDTIILTGARGSGASAIVQGGVAYIAAGGDANFASFPYAVLTSGSITMVDLAAKRVVRQRMMPAGSYGAGARWGANNFLYVSLYEDLSNFTDRIILLNPADLSIITTATTPWMTLTAANGDPMTCGNGVADALSRLHCLVSGAGSATSLVVFNAAGKEIRRVAAGQGGVDLALR
jgi:hypothetical protein